MSHEGVDGENVDAFYFSLYSRPWTVFTYSFLLGGGNSQPTLPVVFWPREPLGHI